MFKVCDFDTFLLLVLNLCQKIWLFGVGNHKKYWRWICSLGKRTFRDIGISKLLQVGYDRYYFRDWESSEYFCEVVAIPEGLGGFETATVFYPKGYQRCHRVLCEAVLPAS